MFYCVIFCTQIFMPIYSNKTLLKNMSKKINILFIMTDQQRLSAVSAYGQTPCQTPHIDRLAAEGTLFENAYTTFPVSSPARASVLTGLSSARARYHCQYPRNRALCTNCPTGRIYSRVACRQPATARVIPASGIWAQSAVRASTDSRRPRCLQAWA